MIDFGIAVAVMGGVGLLVYLVACGYHRVWPPIDKTLEAIGFGGATAIGLRIVYGAFVAETLCCIVDRNGKIVDDANLMPKFGEHTWEIFAGGAAVTIASIYSLVWVCRKPSHHH